MPHTEYYKNKTERSRYHNVKIMVLAIIFLFLQSFYAQAIIWEEIPSFSKANKIKEEEILINTAPAKTIVYQSDSAAQEIMDFYKTSLPSYGGWKLDNLVNRENTTAAVFSKNEFRVSIIIQEIQAKTYILITHSRDQPASLEEFSRLEQEEIEELFAQQGIAGEEEGWEEKLEEFISTEAEKGVTSGDAAGKDLDFVPRYPHSIRLFSVERNFAKKMILVYSTTDSVDNVVSFYRKNMGSFGWNLINEVNFQNMPDKIKESMNNVNLQGMALIFKGPYGECKITINDSLEQIKGSCNNGGCSSGSCIIGVTYDAK